MLKRLCDKCGTEIGDDKVWFRIKCYIMDDNGGGVLDKPYDLCEGCYNNFKGLFANNN